MRHYTSYWQAQTSWFLYVCWPVYLLASGVEVGMENELGGDLDDVLAVNRLVKGLLFALSWWPPWP